MTFNPRLIEQYSRPRKETWGQFQKLNSAKPKCTNILHVAKRHISVSIISTLAGNIECGNIKKRGH